MTKKNKSKNYVPQGNGEEIRVLVAEPADAMDAVLTKLERSLGLLFGVGRSLAIPAIRKGR